MSYWSWCCFVSDLSTGFNCAVKVPVLQTESLPQCFRGKIPRAVIWEVRISTKEIYFLLKKLAIIAGKQEQVGCLLLKDTLMPSKRFHKLLVHITEVRKPAPEPQPDEESELLAGRWVQESIPLAGSGAGIHLQLLSCCSRYRFYLGPHSRRCCWLGKALHSLLPCRAPLPVEYWGTWLRGAATLSAAPALLPSARDWGKFEGK